MVGVDRRPRRMKPAASAWTRILAACVTGLGVAACSSPGALPDCAAKNGLEPLCALVHAPEDLAVVGPWLVLSEMPRANAPGRLLAFRPATSTLLALYPPQGSASRPSEGAPVDASDDGGCHAGKPPPPIDFAPHGLDLAGSRLLVVNHGRREAVEEFVLGADANGLTLEWKSCTPLPPDASANDVVALEDGGFAATKMVERPQWKGIAKLLLGMKTGELLRHSPTTRVWTPVPNTAGRAPNGVEVDAEGRFYIAEWMGRRIVRVAADGSGREEVALDFSPDNLAWASDGRLLVAGQRASVFAVPGCAKLEDETCAVPSVVVAIDPTTMQVAPILDDDPATVVGAASIAVELEGDLWIGSFAGNRLVRRKGVR